MKMFQAVYDASQACSAFCRYVDPASAAGGRNQSVNAEQRRHAQFVGELQAPWCPRRCRRKRRGRSSKKRRVGRRRDDRREREAMQERERRIEAEKRRLADVARGEMVKRPWEFDDAEEALNYGVFGWRWEDWRDNRGNALPGVMGLDEDIARPLAPWRGPVEARLRVESEKREDEEEKYRGESIN